MSTGSGLQKRDNNNIALTLAGFSTGILLNEYDRNVGSTVTTVGTPTNGSSIITALIANGGFLTFGIQDATNSPSNTFDYFGGTASLTLTVTEIPFSPSATAGFAGVGVLLLRRRWRSIAACLRNRS